MNYNKIYNNIVKRGKNRVLEGYKERHHILPRSLGGSDEKENLVDLTAREHFLCHYLLTFIHKKGSLKWYKMVKAFMMMKSSSVYNDRYFNSVLYEKLRTDFSVVMSFEQTGQKNSQYGTVWVFNDDLKKSKKIPKGELPQWIEKGWVKGRKLIFDRKKKTKICNKCGSEKCLKPEICSKHQMINTLIKLFGFDKKKLGSKHFYEEYDRIVEKINKEYHIDKKSTIELSKKYDISTQRIDSIFKSLGIKPRDLSEAALNSVSKKDMKGSNNPNYGKCYIYNLELKDSKLIKKEELEVYLSSGWLKGRKINF